MSDAGSHAYAQRQQRRDDREREELRDTYQRLLLASALRRELGELAKDAGKLAEQATGSGRVAQTAGRNDGLNWPHCDVLNWPHLRVRS